MRFVLLGLICAGFAVSTFSQTADRVDMPSSGLAPVDRSVYPCDNFYKFSCDTWIKSHPIPADQPSWGRFAELAEKNLAILHDILDADVKKGQSAGPIEQKLGLFYGACMDQEHVNSLGIKPIQPELDKIQAVHDLASLSDETARLQRLGVNALFQVSSQQDFKDASKEIAAVDQGGLGLPDRDYYFRKDADSAKLREEYVSHVASMFVLLGEPREKAADDAQTVMRIETALADGSQDNVTRRDPLKVYHVMAKQDLVALAPAFDWKLYLPEVKADYPSMNVVAPDFFKALGKLLSRLSFDDWKTYLTWHLVHARAPWLPDAFVAGNFSFYGQKLVGQKEERARWKRCVSLTDGDLGEALGQEYVTRTFGAEGKARTLEMVRNIEAAMKRDIESSGWMERVTKEKAVAKLQLVANKIGYPDKWRDYSKVEVIAGDLTGNDIRATEFEFDRQMAKIGKPVDKQEWQMTPPTVNAYYDPSMNNINFPAGILQPPFYSNGATDAENYGAAGMVVGHELTHGFDDQGRQFDGNGNLTDWWTKDDAANYETRAKCIEDEYGGFVAEGDVKENGKLTAGENIADNGGLRLAYMALTQLMAGKKISDVDGFTPDQQFFLGFANSWCESSTPELRRLLAQTDVHSLPEYRVNGLLQNMPEFSKAWSCKAGQPMVSSKPCRVW